MRPFSLEPGYGRVMVGWWTPKELWLQGREGCKGYWGCRAVTFGLCGGVACLRHRELHQYQAVLSAGDALQDHSNMSGVSAEQGDGSGFSQGAAVSMGARSGGCTLPVAQHMGQGCASAGGSC